MSPSSSSAKISLFLFGAFRSECNSRAIHLPTRKVESLLAYLALFPEPHPREQLAALLWGDSTDHQARHSLRTALAAIRRELGNQILITDRESVQFNSDAGIWVDARQFQEIQKSDTESLNLSISLYTGDLLPDFYDDWVVRERERVRLLYIDALLQLTQHYRCTSDYTRAIKTAPKSAGNRSRE